MTEPVSIPGENAGFSFQVGASCWNVHLANRQGFSLGPWAPLSPSPPPVASVFQPLPLPEAFAHVISFAWNTPPS